MERQYDGLNMYLFAQRLRETRAARGLSQTELAARCGMNLGNLNELERGKSSGLRAATLVRLAHALNCSLDYLCALTDAPRPRPTGQRQRTRKAAPVG
jgi:transcriptional regulator with XRE-family HTH domain